jgi:mono/diheme cytochrome c family protein
MMTAVFSAGAAVQNDAFERTWMRTDRPVVDGQVSRTWMWGPIETAFETTEPYVQAPGGQRLVAYFDKSRMEITNPDGDQSSIWYVTNGLLSTELITGNMQMGDNEFEQREPAQVNVAGDAGDPTGPTYATFGAVLDAPAADVGTVITARIDRAGVVTQDPSLVARNVLAGQFDDVTNHTVAEPFWDFMTSVGIVYQDGAFTIDFLFENPVFATGRPITEAYWANVQVAGTYQDVLMQCFERRCLTYTPDNPPGWQVEAGNVGQHYHAWRYGDGNGNGGEPGSGDPVAGALVFQNNGCIGCHGPARLGPPLNGLYLSPTMLADGTTVVADEAYIRESIVDPTAKIVMGYPDRMPPFDHLSDQELDDLVAYIMTLE